MKEATMILGTLLLTSPPPRAVARSGPGRRRPRQRTACRADDGSIAFLCADGPRPGRNSRGRGRRPRFRGAPVREIWTPPASARDDGEPMNGGAYVDLGSIPFVGDVGIALEEKTGRTDNPLSGESIKNWRSKHWIALVYDEPAIRLAIGDHLHSSGYSVVTACDGPMAFLEVLLWSCSWSLSENGKKNEGGEGGRTERPPWILRGDDGRPAPWRLPDCVISDIRMPGGINGVQLLELLRPPPVRDDAGTVAGSTEKKKKKKKGKKKKKRGISRREDSVVGNYDERDDFELLDAIVAGDAGRAKERITTPTDQAAKYLDAIRVCIQCHGQDPEGQEKGQATCQCPSSLQEMPVILLTAKAMVSDRIAGYKAGANGYLPKPFRPEELLGMVDNLMRKKERERKKSVRAENDGAIFRDPRPDIFDLTAAEVRDIAKDVAEIRRWLSTRKEGIKTEEERTDRDRLAAVLPEAMWMLNSGERRKRVFTKDHMRSILLLCFGVEAFPRRNDSNVRRGSLLAELEEQIARHPEKLTSGRR